MYPLIFIWFTDLCIPTRKLFSPVKKSCIGVSSGKLVLDGYVNLYDGLTLILDKIEKGSFVGCRAGLDRGFEVDFKTKAEYESCTSAFLMCHSLKGLQKVFLLQE